jgi:hypothetical protein
MIRGVLQKSHLRASCVHVFLEGFPLFLTIVVPYFQIYVYYSKLISLICYILATILNGARITVVD